MTSDLTEPGRGLRVAIVGGGMVAGLHRRAARLAGAELIGVLGSSPEKSRDLGARWGVAGFDSMDQLLESAVDVVHVCTPNASHHPYTMAALAAGKHVVCEKPLGTSGAEAQAMADAAREAGLVGAVPFVYRYHPLTREIRARRLAGEFGAWNLIHGSYLQDWLLSPAATSWRVDPGVNGPSRAFADIGSHWFDLVEWVSGEIVERLLAELSIAIPQRYAATAPAFSGDVAGGELQDVTTEDNAVVLFRTTSGVAGSATISQVAAGRKNRLWFELDGAVASVAFDQELAESIWIGRPDGSVILRRDPLAGDETARALSLLPAGHVQGYAECFELFVADVYRAVRGGDPAGLPTFADGLRSMRVVEAVLASARTHTWKDIAS